MLNAFKSLWPGGNKETNGKSADIGQSSILPLEIHGLIIDMLVAENCKLNAYSRTCQAILSLCRQRMFAQVTFNLPWNTQADQQRLQRFAKIMSRSPELGDLIRRVQLNINDTRFQGEDENVLKALHARVGSIEHLGITTSGLNWGKLLETPRYGPLVEAFLHSTYLSSLELRGIDDFKMADLSCCTSLSRLNLKLRPAVILHDELPPSAIYLPPNLQHLTIDHTSPTALASNSAEPLSPTPSLRSLHATMRAIGVARLIAAHVHSLDSFSLTWTFSFVNQDQKDFRKLGEALRANLSSLKILSFTLPNNTNHETAMDNIAALLRAIATPPAEYSTIEDVSIAISTGTASRATRFADSCAKIDDVLSIQGAWPLLNRVSVDTELVGQYSGRQGAVDTLKSLSTRFPRLAAANVLQCRFRDNAGQRRGTDFAS